MANLESIQSEKEAVEKVCHQLAGTTADDGEQTAAEIICRDQRRSEKRDIPKELKK
eukprot:SAG22_NODE_16931_length_314_cov_1.195349_1_plen_55_part_10